MNTASYNQLCATLQGVAQAQGYVLVSHDEHAVNKLDELSGMYLACVLPNKTFSGEPDSIKTISTIIIYVIEKDDDGQGDEAELQQYIRTEEALDRIIQYLRYGAPGTHCIPYPDLRLHDALIAPEYREFGGWNGWSITVSL